LAQVFKIREGLRQLLQEDQDPGNRSDRQSRNPQIFETFWRQHNVRFNRRIFGSKIAFD